MRTYYFLNQETQSRFHGGRQKKACGIPGRVPKIRALSGGLPNSHPSHAGPGFSFSAAPGEDHGVNGKDGSGSSEGAGSVSEGTVTALEVNGRERCSSLPSSRHLRPLGTACVPGTRRLQVAGTKAVGFLFPPRCVGRIQMSAVEKGPACPRPPTKLWAHFPSEERLLPTQLGSCPRSLRRSALSSHFTEI